MTAGTRPAAVAGSFYPADAAQLGAAIDAMLGEAQRSLPAHFPSPKAIVAPHAGYLYSGPIAASVYARLAPLAGRIRRVILLGPAHRVAMRGIARSGATHFLTPLGAIPIDLAAESVIAASPQVIVSPQAHAQEHSLEVHLPFLQRVLGGFSLVPLVVGRASPEEVAQVLEQLWGTEDTLLVISSDLSHYLPYDRARQIDHDTAQAVLALRPSLNHEQACGATPVNGLLLAATRKGLAPQLHDLRNSGDTAGDRSRVVGYASFGFYPGSSLATAGDEEAAESPQALGESLLPLARASIGAVLGVESPAHRDHAALHRFGACFVTLTRERALRGCIGSLQAHRTLLEDVQANARAAAFTDPRFEPLSVHEFRQVRVEVSLLSASEPMRFADEDEALAALRPGIDGVILEWTRHRSTFLPQVWEQLPDPRSFLAQLKRKAGLPERFWAHDLRLHRYTVTKWVEHAVPGSNL